MPNSLKNVLGAAAGGIVGYLLFAWFLRYGFYAMIAPGGLLGIGGAIYRHRAPWLPVVTGGSALLLGLFAEWRQRPFAKDESFHYFLNHLSDLTPVTWLMVVAGAGLAFYFPFTQYRKAVLLPY